MKTDLIRRIFSVALIVSGLAGCDPVENRQRMGPEECAIPPVSADEACQNVGLSLVAECEEGTPEEECREITYQVGGDCGEATATVYCGVPIGCAIPPVSAEEACQNEGLSLVDACPQGASENECREITYQVGGDCGEATATVFCGVQEDCAIPPVSAEEACESEGLDLVEECAEDAPADECRQITYQVGGDCGEATATVFCGAPIACAIPPVSAEEACENVGLSLVEVCAADAPEEACREVTYQVGGDCGEETATVFCGEQEDCAIPPVSAEEACANEGLAWVEACDEGENERECREITYQVGGDCGEAMATTFCAGAPIACAIPPVSAEEACQSRGLSLVDGCIDDGSQMDCQQVTYQVGGDCGEAMATVTCANVIE